MIIPIPITYYRTRDHEPIIMASELNYMCARLKELFNPGATLPFVFVPGTQLRKTEILENMKVILEES